MSIIESLKICFKATDMIEKIIRRIPAGWNKNMTQMEIS